jgi:hypothetical protein
MMIRREDLAAAASVGLLHYSQVDPLLVYLLQRDVRAKRLALAAQARAPRRNWFHRLLYVAAAFLAVLTASLFILLLATRVASSEGPMLLGFSVLLYTALGVALAVWSRGRGYGTSIGVTLLVLMASLPLAVFALHQAAA